MKLPEQLEELRDRKIWLCYPLLWNEKKHNGVGGYDKPPINPYTLYMAKSDDPKSLATYDEAAAQIGKTARVKVKDKSELVECEVAGVGIAFSGTGIIGLDMDNVADGDRRVMTPEAHEIVELLDSYTELSPSGTGLHIIALGKLPEDIGKKLTANRLDIMTKTNKAEYQLFNSGYMAISGDSIGDRKVGERTDQIAELYKKYFVDEIVPPAKLSTAPPNTASSVVSCSTGYSYERWLEEVKRLSDADILKRIFVSGSTGRKVEALYNGDMSDYGNDHSRADQALCTFLYGFTSDRDTTERLFRASSLYRAKGKSRTYLNTTLNKAARDCKQLVGHIEFTAEEKKTYAQKKEKEERERGIRYNSQTTKERYNHERRKI